MFSIGEFSKLTQLTVKTLRFYHPEGLPTREVPRVNELLSLRFKYLSNMIRMRHFYRRLISRVQLVDVQKASQYGNILSPQKRRMLRQKEPVYAQPRSWADPGLNSFGTFGQADGTVNRNRIAAKLLGAVAVVSLLAVVVGTFVRYSDGAVRIPPPPAWSPDAPDEDQNAVDPEPQFRLDAPSSDDGADAGVEDAARDYAIKFVTPDLKNPESAEFPKEAIRFKRLDLLNRTTGGKIEHWFVDGAVDSKNDYGAMVRSHWRILLGRTEDSFFPVMAILEEFGIYRMRGHVQMLAEARQAAWQRLEVAAAEQKAKELAASRAVWKAIETAKPDEEKAAAALKLAVSLLDVGRKEAAQRRLQEIIEKFPDTSAAARAAELLKE